MDFRKLLARTATAATLLMAATLPAVAGPLIPINGYTGPVTLTFQNYESFLTSSGTVDSSPAQGDTNFGIFAIQSISSVGFGGKALYNQGDDGHSLLGVFSGITVTNVSGTGSSVKTTNSGGIFSLYWVPNSQVLGDLGLAGYGAAGCSIGGTCYHGITDVGQLALTITLTPGVVSGDPNTTLVANLDETLNPPTGSAAFQGLLSGTSQFASFISGKDSFCPNNSSTCAGADNVANHPGQFALASQDPISATAVPEPGALVLLGVGLVGLGLARYGKGPTHSGS